MHTLTESDLATLRALKAEADKERSFVEFSREYLPFGSSKLSKIFDALETSKGSYFDSISTESGQDLIAELKAILDDLPRLRARREQAEAADVVELPRFRAVRLAVEECGAKRNPERLIKYLSPTGGGKTMLCHYLARRASARVVESREAWKRSYYTVLSDLARAVGCRLADESRPSAIEDKLISMLAQQKTVLAIDEGEFFGTAALNGIKLLLNRTRLVIVLCAIPAAHDRWNRYYELEAAQLDRRTHAVVTVDSVSPEEAGLFFAPNLFVDREAALARLAESATSFGAYALLNRVAQRLARKERCDAKELDTAIKGALRSFGRRLA